MEQENMGEQSPAPEKPKKGSAGPVVGIIIIIIVIILGGYYFLSGSEDTTPVEVPAPTENAGDGSGSDELPDIEADLTGTDVDDLDADLGDLDADLDALESELETI